MTLIACPRCGSDIKIDRDKLVCLACDFVGATRSGIWDLRVKRFDYYFNPVSRSLMHSLSRDQAVEDWAATIRTFIAEVNYNPDWIDNLMVHGRYAWKLFLDIPERAALLDVGCGLGNLLHNLAPQFETVYGIDLTWERLLFSQRRFALFNPTHRIELIAGGDGERLPLKDASFDCITLSGVLEWIPAHIHFGEDHESRVLRVSKIVGSFFGSTNPRREQLSFLREIRRVLKPNGQLFVAIENRYNYEYFKGRRDHHSSLRYGSLLPRFVANLYSLVKCRKPYRTYTHSRVGYCRLLRRAGFRQIEFLGLIEGYSHLREIVPYGGANQYWRHRAFDSISERIKHYPFFVPAFGITARPSRKPPGLSLIDRMAQSILSHLAADSDAAVVLTSMMVTAKDKAVIEGECGKDSFVIRIPLSQQACHGEAVNWQMLHKQNARAVGCPEPLAMGEFVSCPYYVERTVPGVPLKSEQARSVGSALRLLQRYLDYWPKGQRQQFDKSLAERCINAPLSMLRAVSKRPDLVDTLNSYLSERLCDAPVNVGLTHGDFSVSNIFVDGASISGVIDWEYADSAGLQVLDVFSILESIYRWRKGTRLVTVVDVFGALERMPKDYVGFVSHQLEAQGLERSRLMPFAILSWLDHMHHQLAGRMIFDERAIADRIDAGLKFIEGCITG